MNIKELEAKARELKELQRMAEEIAEEMDAIKAEIRAAVEGRETTYAGAYKITLKDVTSSRLDSAAIKRELPEIAARYTKTTTAQRLTIA